MSNPYIDDGHGLGAIIAGGSHDVKPRRRRADRQIIRKAIGYASRNAYVSLKTIRAADDRIDDNKFLMPVCANLSSSDLQLFSMLRNERVPRIVAVVSEEGAIKAETIGCFTNAGDRLRIVVEPNPPGFFKTHKAALDELRDLKDGARVGFVALDTPFAYDLSDMLHREEPFDGAYMDCNARERVFGDGRDLFNRNWYFIVRTRDGDVVHAKECNRWEYNLGRLRKSLEQVEINSGYSLIYADRESGNLISSKMVRNFLRLMPSRLINNPGIAAGLLFRGFPGFLNYYLRNRIGNKIGLEIAGNVRGYEDIVSFLLGMPVHLEFNNRDLALVRDIDDRYDRDYYQLIFEAAVETFGDVKQAFVHLFPDGDCLCELNGVMGEVNQRIPMLKNFPAHETRRRAQLRRQLEVYGRARRNTYGLEIREAYDRSGNFIGQPSEGDDIEGSLDYFVEKAADFRRRLEAA